MTDEEERALRAENAALKAQVAQLQPLAAQVEPLQEQVRQLNELVQALQEHLKKDSHNSHLPPSSDRFVRRTKSLRQQSGKRAGGQPGHVGSTLCLSETPDAVIVHEVEQCAHCQQDLRGVACLQRERRQVIDVPPKRVVVIEHQAQSKCCPACQRVSTAAFPEEVRAPVQYSAAFGAIAVYLVEQQLLPYERACEVMEDLLGPPMRVGTLQSMIAHCSQQLAPIEEQIKAALQQAEVLHQDETGMRVAGKGWWTHVSATASLTHYTAHPKRGQVAMDAIGILPHFVGISIHDGLKSYFRYSCEHALCNAHHLRELTFVAEQQQQQWAAAMKELLLDLKAAVQQARQAGRSGLDALELADWQQQYAALLLEGMQANPPDPPPEGAATTKGRRKHSPAHNLLERLARYQEEVLRFASDFRVDFDNNLAERDLRMVKLQQKISGTFRSAEGAHAFCRIRGYLSTLRKQGAHLLTALELALLGHPIAPLFSPPE